MSSFIFGCQSCMPLSKMSLCRPCLITPVEFTFMFGESMFCFNGSQSFTYSGMDVTIQRTNEFDTQKVECFRFVRKRLKAALFCSIIH